MSVIARSKEKSVQGSVEAANGRGIKLGGSWYDYLPGYRGDRPDADAVGVEVELSLVESFKKPGRFLIQGLEVIQTAASEDVEGAEPEESEVEEKVEAASPEEPKAPEESGASATTEPPASEKSVTYAKDLAEKAGIGGDDLTTIARIRFGKGIEKLARPEASLLIEFLGGYSRRSGGRRPSGS